MEVRMCEVSYNYMKIRNNMVDKLVKKKTTKVEEGAIVNEYLSMQRTLICSAHAMVTNSSSH